MKFIRLPQFDADYSRLSAEERKKFKEMLRVMIDSCKEYEKSPQRYVWPASLRFERLTGTRNVCAITWSFSGPDGRATFHFDTVDGEIYLVWRRVGRHAIYKNP